MNRIDRYLPPTTEPGFSVPDSTPTPSVGSTVRKRDDCSEVRYALTTEDIEAVHQHGRAARDAELFRLRAPRRQRRRFLRSKHRQRWEVECGPRYFTLGVLFAVAVFVAAALVRWGC